MKASHYNFYLNLFQDNSHGVIYNTNSGAVLMIRDRNIWNFLTTGEGSLPDDEDLLPLVDAGVCVESFEEEFGRIRARYERAIYHSDTLHVTILPTEACNFACPYCFVWEKTPTFMSNEVYAKIQKYIRQTVTENKEIKRVMLNWFGGEPTLCTNSICTFMKELSSWTEQQGLMIEASITTNGFLLNVDNFCMLYRSNVTHYQVTVDGTKEAHNSGRPLKNGGGSYSTILENLIAIHNLPQNYEYQMDIRCNFRKSTVQAVTDFINVFKNEFASDERFHIYCRPVYAYETKENDVENMLNDIFSLEDGLAQQNAFANMIEEIRPRTSERRIVAPLPQPTLCWCNADIESTVMIGTKGDIYICDTLAGEANSIGRLSDEGIETQSSVRFNIFEDDRTKKCMTCKLLPICMGGCMRNRINGEAQCFWTPEGIQKTLESSYRNM